MMLLSRLTVLTITFACAASVAQAQALPLGLSSSSTRKYNLDADNAYLCNEHRPDGESVQRSRSFFHCEDGAQWRSIDHDVSSDKVDESFPILPETPSHEDMPLLAKVAIAYRGLMTRHWIWRIPQADGTDFIYQILFNTPQSHAYKRIQRPEEKKAFMLENWTSILVVDPVRRVIIRKITRDIPH